MNVLANYTGYWIGIGIEAFVIVVCTVLLILLLTGVLFNWIEKSKERAEENKIKREEEKVRKEAERAAREAEREARAAEVAAARAAAEAEAAAAAAEEEEEEEAEEEVAEEPKPQPKAQPKAEAKAESKATSASETKTEEETVIEETETTKIKKKVKKVEEITEETEEVAEDDGGLAFGESKTITELYDELSAEQKGYFDELREEALTKPNAELSISRNFVTVKIGKRNLIKLLIKRGVTVAEFILENEQIKQLRLSEKNKRGKSAIKVKPTTVQVIDLQSLKVAIDMITLAYEELILDN